MYTLSLLAYAGTQKLEYQHKSRSSDFTCPGIGICVLMRPSGEVQVYLTTLSVMSYFRAVLATRRSPFQAFSHGHASSLFMLPADLLTNAAFDLVFLRSKLL